MVKERSPAVRAGIIFGIVTHFAIHSLLVRIGKRDFGNNNRLVHPVLWNIADKPDI
jgi:hypothetical protein